MWWWLEKLVDDDIHVVYAYGRETQETTGEVSYDKVTGTASVLRVADNDWPESAEHFVRSPFRHVVRRGFPDTIQIAIG